MTQTVLIADDDPVLRNIIERQLRANGIQTEAAGDGEVAYSRLRSGAKPIDLLIADVNMPVLDGLNLAKKCRHTPSIASIPLIMITSEKDPRMIEKIFEAGATNYLAKPINWTLFAVSVKFMLRAAQNEKSLRTTTAALAKASRFKDSLLAVMNHELRTPLHTIIGFGQMLEQKFCADNMDEQRKYAEHIVESGNRLLRALSDVLLLSQALSGPLSMLIARINVNDLAEEVLYTYRKIAKEKNITITYRAPEEKIYLLTDQILCKQSFEKLIDNGVKFSPAQASVHVRLERYGKSGIVFSVSDEGEGIPEKFHKSLADGFMLPEEVLTRSHEGMGLGLAVAAHIAAAHKGSVSLDNKRSRGATAMLILRDAPLTEEQGDYTGIARPSDQSTLSPLDHNQNAPTCSSSSPGWRPRGNTP